MSGRFDLPMIAASCALDADGLRRQRDRYAQIGRGARVLDRGPTRRVLQLAATADPQLIEEALAVERGCCPFFSLDFDPVAHRLAIAVPDATYAPALDAIAEALAPADATAANDRSGDRA